MIQKHVDAVVIGAGAGGGIVAKELAAAGLSVVLFERGKWYTPWDCHKDDLRNQRTTVLGNAFGPEPDERYPRVVEDAPGKERVIEAWEGGYSNNAGCVGGGTLSYGAMAWRFMEQDFRLRSTYRAVEGSTLDDWPITYNDLEPYYTKAEWEIGVSGDNTQNPFAPKQSKPLPMPPLPPTREHQLLETAAKKKGLHPFPIPMLRNSVPYQGRAACMRCRWCVGFACEVDAKCGTQNTVIPTALKTGNCELRTEAVVSEILTDGRGHGTGVVYFDANDTRHEQPADIVIVSACAVESARLLLNSKSRLFPNGLGNRHDWVGRNLQGHTYTGAWGLFDFDTYDDLGPGASVAICDYNHGNPGLVGGAMLANEFIRLPIHFMNTRPDDVPRWGAGHKDYMRQFYRRSMTVMGPTQEMPVWDSRVQVDPKVRDYWGVPVARLSGFRHPHTIEIGNEMSKRAVAWLEAAGAAKIWPRKAGQGISGGQHQAGTCRMGKDPKTSAVNEWGQVHEVDNVFVADGSVHVTNGGFNPVLTIMAIAYRTSDYIVREWKGTRFRS
jgi:choline dehydrogenase-like flavoprotein